MAIKYGMETPKLGFGLMRLPKKGIAIDVEQTKRMVDLFMETGFTYFDTAFVYPGSETATRKALVERYPRDSYTLATKLNVLVAPTERIAKKEFETSLERTGAGYFDYYLLHALMKKNANKYENLHLWEFVNEQKAKGVIKNVGFSFHDSPELLDELLTEHPEVDFVQLQINYADWNDPKVASRANYEVARKHGKPVVVMEPVKGGNLADPPKEVKALFDAANPGASYASWAIRFAASLPGIMTVLSGMSNIEQMENNLSFMKDFRPLSDEEQATILKAQELMGLATTIPCTTCGYCMEGCPQKILIPNIFMAMNNDDKELFAQAISENGKPSDCIACGQCEEACPQHIPIIENLKKAKEKFE